MEHCQPGEQRVAQSSIVLAPGLRARGCVCGSRPALSACAARPRASVRQRGSMEGGSCGGGSVMAAAVAPVPAAVATAAAMPGRDRPGTHLEAFVQFGAQSHQAQEGAHQRAICEGPAAVDKQRPVLQRFGRPLKCPSLHGLEGGTERGL